MLKTRLFQIVVFTAVYMLVSSISAFAAVEKISGEGEYIMEDNETLKDAQEVAYKEAMRSISQQVAVYVKSKSQAEDFQITDDVVELISTTVLKVEEKKFVKEIMPDGKLKIKAFVSVTLDEAVNDKVLNDKIAAFREKKRYDKSLAERKEQEHQLENAEKEYNAALRNTSAAILEEADSLYKRKDYSGAIARYTEIIERHPTFATAYVGRGDAYFELKQYDKASKDFQKAYDIEPKNAGAFFGKAKIFEYQGKRSEAVENYRLFIKYANIAKDNDKITAALDKIAKLEG